MANFDPIEIVTFCIIIASIIIVSPHWLILWQKHKKEKLLKENFNVPHINKSSCCYNVGQEVIDGVTKSVNNTNGLFYNKNDKIYIDLKEVNKRQLEEFGLPTENIDTCPYCTSCNNDLFFSYRKENGTTNRHNAIIKLI